MESAGIGYQCEYLTQNAYHIFENRYVEILDPDTNECLENGKVGKIVVTSLDKRLIPLLRYDTGDIGKIEASKCLCGTQEVLWVQGRAGKEIIIASVHINLQTIANLVQAKSKTYLIHQIIVKKTDSLDQIEIRIVAEAVQEPELLKAIVLQYPDLNDCIKQGKIKPIHIQKVCLEQIELNNKTGKVYPFIDKRN